MLKCVGVLTTCFCNIVSGNAKPLAIPWNPQSVIGYTKLSQYIWYGSKGCTKKLNSTQISQLPRGLEISSWTFFNCPFRVDSENILYFII